MFGGALNGVLTALFTWALFALGTWRRAQETDDLGNPQLMYFGPRFSMPIATCFFFAIGLYELNDPINYRYSGNLLILAYTPLAIAAFTLVVSVYFWRYRIILKRDKVEYMAVWPSRPGEFSLKQVTGLTKPSAKQRAYTIVNFSDGGQFKINGLLSGQAYFYEKLNEALKQYGNRDGS